MTTHALPHPTGHWWQRLAAHPPAVQTTWLGGGFLLAFLMPFVLADTLELDRDLYYGFYAVGVAGYFALWARSTGQPLRAMVARRLPLTLGLAAVASGLLALMVFRTEDATPRPAGIELVAALAWRGVVYGAADGLLLSAFPILVVFAAFAGTKLRQRRSGFALIALVAMAASIGMTAVYHAGYSDFRGAKMRKPVTGDLVWSAPTLLTLNPIGAPIAHIALHTSAVLHSYETDTFLPPHKGS